MPILSSIFTYIYINVYMHVYVCMISWALSCISCTFETACLPLILCLKQVVSCCLLVLYPDWVLPIHNSYISLFPYFVSAYLRYVDIYFHFYILWIREIFPWALAITLLAISLFVDFLHQFKTWFAQHVYM